MATSYLQVQVEGLNAANHVLSRPNKRSVMIDGCRPPDRSVAAGLGT